MVEPPTHFDASQGASMNNKRSAETQLVDTSEYISQRMRKALDGREVRF